LDPASAYTHKETARPLKNKAQKADLHITSPCAGEKHHLASPVNQSPHDLWQIALKRQGLSLRNPNERLISLLQS